jgi:hypothetical protein
MSHGMPLRALCLLLIVGGLAGTAAGCGSAERTPPKPDAKRADLEPTVRATVRVGDRGDSITGLAAGPDGVWVGSGGRCSGLVSEVDAERNEVVATIPVEVVYDVAVGADAVWAVGGECLTSTRADPDVLEVDLRVLRIDPDSDQIVANIPLAGALGGRRPSDTQGLAADERAVWVSVNFGPSAGELVRIDPATNQVVQRAPAGGYVGELAVRDGVAWALSNPEWTDEASGRAGALIRTDPRTGSLPTPRWRGRLDLLGGSEVPPLLAAGSDAVWIRSSESRPPFRTLAVRVDARTNDVTRRRIVSFFPFASTERGVWFIGSSGPHAALVRLNPQTGERDEAVELRETAIDAAIEPAGRTIWLADPGLPRERRAPASPAILRVDLR